VVKKSEESVFFSFQMFHNLQRKKDRFFRFFSWGIELLL